jgi:hypothetical protein
MWRFLTFFLLGGVCGTAFGVAVGFFAFPYVFPPPPAMETLAEAELTPALARGSFIHANPSDPVHHGTGGVTLRRDSLFLEQDFKVGPGPKYHVYLVPKAGIRASSDLQDTMYVDLGRLRAFEGSQKYDLPGGLALDDYSSVVIWCEQFGVLISSADLTFQQ